MVATNEPRPIEKRFGGWRPDTALRAMTAGVAYFTLLFGAGGLLAGANTVWLDPLFGPAAAFAIELTIMLPAAWFMNELVAWSFGITPGWPMGVIVAGTTIILLAIAYFAVLALLGAVVARTILNQGWMETRFVAQILMAALPFAYPRN